MWLGIISLVLFLFIILYRLFMRSFKEETKKQVKQYEENLKTRNIISENKLIHLGGHPYLNANDKISFQIKTNNTICFYKENTNTGAEILISKLIKYEVKTETEIQKDVTLTRLLALGIFAFGVKKKTKIEDQYLILSYIQNNVEINCIFKRWYQGTHLGDLISTLNRLKIEENKKPNL